MKHETAYPNNLVEGLPGPSFPYRTVAGLLIVATGIGAYAGERLNQDPALFPKVAVGYFTDNECDSVPTEVRTSVAENLDAPQDQYTQNIFDTTVGTAEINRFDDAHADYAIEVAKANNLTLLDFRPYQKAIDQADTIEQTLTAVNSYTSQHGFKVAIPDNPDIKDIGLGIDTIDKENVAVEKLKNGSQKFINSLFYIPTELTAIAGFRELRIVDDISPISGINESPDGLATLLSDVIYARFDAYSEGKYPFFTHEIAHKIDYAVCGVWGSDRDPEYRKLNTSDFRYGSSDQDSALRYLNVIDGYSAMGVAEDKANMYEDMLNGINYRLANSQLTIINNKYRLLLARLENKVPGISSYLSRISLKDSRLPIDDPSKVLATTQYAVKALQEIKILKP